MMVWNWFVWLLMGGAIATAVLVGGKIALRWGVARLRSVVAWNDSRRRRLPWLRSWQIGPGLDARDRVRVAAWLDREAGHPLDWNRRVVCDPLSGRCGIELFVSLPPTRNDATGEFDTAVYWVPRTHLPKLYPGSYRVGDVG